MAPAKITFNSIVSKVSLISGYISGIFALGIMILMCAEVAFRYIFSSPIEWEIDVVESLIVACVFMGAAYTLSKEGHVRVDIIIMRLSASKKRYLLALGHLFSLVFVVILTYYLADDAIRSFELKEMTSGVVPLPYFPIKALAAFGSLLLALQLLTQITLYLLYHNEDR